MAKKDLQKTDELAFFLEEKILELPKKIQKEVLNFKKRNSITKNICCPNCLKAHLIKKHNLSILKCKTGHNGYYLDKNKLIKISS